MAKLEILENSWNKLLGKIHKCNENKVRSATASELIVKIGMVKPEIRRAALEEFLRHSQRVHTIAFLQWRKKYPRKETDHKQLSDLIEERIKYMYGNLKCECKASKSENKLPASDLSSSEEFYDDFKNSIKNAKCFNIWSFGQIGMYDPFPEEHMETHFHVPETQEDLVYRGNRYIKGNSPNLLYFPSKLLLFKIMKACVGI